PVQPARPVADPPSHGTGQARARWAGLDRGRSHDPARWSYHPHDARVWRVAWRRLHVRALGALAPRLSLNQSRVANVRWPAPRPLRRAYATMASRLCTDLPVRRGGDG